jgi:hypothetical protein
MTRVGAFWEATRAAEQELGALVCYHKAGRNRSHRDDEGLFRALWLERGKNKVARFHVQLWATDATNIVSIPYPQLNSKWQ